MLPAGKPTNQTLEELRLKLAPGDLVVNGGNSFYKETVAVAETFRLAEIQLVDAGLQRSRDVERRRVLDVELREAEARLATVQGEYAGGNAERQGSESRNYQKYLDRMADLKASVNRQESDIQALKREISKLP